jgi:hypothetical protein
MSAAIGEVFSCPEVGTQYSELEMYWIIKYGIRNTAMLTYGPFYSGKQASGAAN